MPKYSNDEVKQMIKEGLKSKKELPKWGRKDWPWLEEITTKGAIWPWLTQKQREMVTEAFS